MQEHHTTGGQQSFIGFHDANDTVDRLSCNDYKRIEAATVTHNITEDFRKLVIAEQPHTGTIELIDKYVKIRGKNRGRRASTLIKKTVINLND